MTPLSLIKPLKDDRGSFTFFSSNENFIKLCELLVNDPLWYMFLMKEYVLSFQEKTSQPWFTYFQIATQY